MCRFKLFTALNGMLCIDVCILYILLELLTIGQSCPNQYIYNICTYVYCGVCLTADYNCLIK